MTTSNQQDRQLSELYQKLSVLQAEAGTGWYPLPNWARFYLELGTILARLPSTGNRVVAALAVPSRSYVSVLVATGFVAACAVDDKHLDQKAEHLRRLKNLPNGASVYVRNKGRRLRGIYRGCHLGFGKQLYFSVQTEEKNSTTYSFPAVQAHKIEVLEEEKEMQLPKRQRGRAFQELSPLASYILGGVAKEFARQTQLECVMLGTRSTIEREVLSQRFRIISPSQKHQVGVLQDILRLHTFLPKNTPYRTHVIPASNRRAGSLARKLKPHTVFFDGGLSFLRWYQDWYDSHAVIVLDRTEPNFEAARNQINQQYVQYRLAKTHSLEIPQIPPSIELMMFEVQR